MKNITLPLLFVFAFAMIATPLWAATADASKPAGKSPAMGMATAVTTVTGIAISPLMGTGAYGAYLYFHDPGGSPSSLALVFANKFLAAGSRSGLRCGGQGFPWCGDASGLEEATRRVGND